MSFWSEIRTDFPITRNCIYLDHASAGPVPVPVQEKILKHYQEHVTECDMAWPKWMQRRDEVRQKVADFIGAEPSEVAFIHSTSQGMNAIAELLAGEGEVLTNLSEFPSTTLPWLWRKARMVWQKPEKNKIALSTLESLLSPSVKTIMTSFVQYSTGFRQDLKQLGQLKGNRYFVVNATQGLGAMPLNVKDAKIDFLCSNRYKWMMAGYGSGILYIHKKWLERFQPSSVGWRSMNLPDLMNNQKLDLKPEASRYELGSPNFPAIFSFGAAIDYLSGIGIEKIQERILELTDFVLEGLQQKGFEIVTPLEKIHRSGIVVFKIEDPEKVRRRLFQERIYVSVRGEGIRIAPHFYNSFEEIEIFLKKLV